MKNIQANSCWPVSNVMQVLFYLAIGNALLLSAKCTAAPIEINSGVFYSNESTGEGAGRGLGLRADSTYNLNSIGIHADLNPMSFDAQIYASTNGSDTGALLSSQSVVLGGTGFGWQDVPINYTLNAGSYYVLHFRPTVSVSDWVGSGGLDYYNDSGLPVVVGPFTLIDGEEGYTPPLGFGNYAHPSLRVNGIPEPTTLALACLGLSLITMRHRR